MSLPDTRMVSQPVFYMPDDSVFLGARLLQRWAEHAGAEVRLLPRRAKASDLLAFAVRQGMDVSFVLAEANQPRQQQAQGSGTFGEAAQEEDFLADDVGLKLPAELSPEEIKQWFNLQAEYVRQMILDDHVLHSVQGVLLPGNAFDLNPALNDNGGSLHSETTLPPLTDLRFAVEAMLHDYAVMKNIPVLGVCGGMQVMAARHHLPLAQHLPDVSSTVEHRTSLASLPPEDKAIFRTVWEENQRTSRYEKTLFDEQLLASTGMDMESFTNHFNQPPHAIQLAPALNPLLTLLQRHHPAIWQPRVEQGQLSVPSASRHHQGIQSQEALQHPSIHVLGLADDGIAEIIHRTDMDYYWGFQGHIESNVGQMAHAMLKAMVEAAHQRFQIPVPPSTTTSITR